MANTSADFKVTFTKQNWFCLDQSSSQGFHIIHEKRTGGEELQNETITSHNISIWTLWTGAGRKIQTDGVFLHLLPSPLLPIRPTSTWFQQLWQVRCTVGRMGTLKTEYSLETSDVARPVPLGRDKSSQVGLRQITKLVAI